MLPKRNQLLISVDKVKINTAGCWATEAGILFFCMALFSSRIIAIRKRAGVIAIIKLEVIKIFAATEPESNNNYS